MWDKLRAHHAQVSDRRFETLVDAPRAADFSARVDDMVLDYAKTNIDADGRALFCLLYTSPSPRDGLLSRMPSSA